MRRAALWGVAALLASLVEVTPAMAATGPVVLSGALSAPGQVYVYANGQVVASASASPSFAVVLPLSSALSDLAASNNGYVNFDALMTNGSRILIFGFSKMYDPATGTWESGEATPTPGSFDLSNGWAAPSRASAKIADAGACFKILMASDNNVSTTVGELHTYSAQVQDTVTYGKSATADSNISIGVSSNGSTWSFSGTYHVGNTSVAQVQWAQWGPFGHRLQSNFNYGKYQWTCGGYEIDPTQWDGGQTYGQDNSSFDGQCGTTYAKWKEQGAANTHFRRWAETYTTFSAAATVFGIAGFTAQSGLSTYVGMDMWFDQSSGTRSYCGNNNYPTYASRVFQGG